MMCAQPPHHSIAERLFEALDEGDIEYARLEFPAALVPLRENLDAEDDDMIAMDFVVDDDGMRVLGLVTYADFTSDEFEDAPRRVDWTLFDERGVASFNVCFHDVEDAAAWIQEHAVLTLVARDKDEDELEAEYGHLVSDLIMDDE
jgi:hypothetical protein